jgi:thiamine-phosphate pyrophosphorylase
MPAKERKRMTPPRIHCIVSERDDLSLLPALAEAGIDGFQVRAKALGTRDLAGLTRRVVAAVTPYAASVIVNDRVDVALAAGAAGAHLGADDLAVADARKIAPRLLVGATCRDRSAVERAAADGADYAGFGPVYVTDSKSGLPAPLGPRAVTEAAGVLPLIAIAGVTGANAREVRAAGAHGVAVIGAIWRHPDPVSAAKELVSAVGG